MKYLLAIISIALCTAAVVESEDGFCDEGRFSCASGDECISKLLVCDDIPNCADESDENGELCDSWSYYDDYDDEEVEETEEEEEEKSGGGGLFSWYGGGGSDDLKVEEKEVEEKEVEEKEVEEKEVEDVEDEEEEDEEEEEEEESGGGGGFFSWYGGGGSDDETDYETDDTEFGNEENCSVQKCELKGPLSFVTDKRYSYRYEVLSQTQSTTMDGNQTSSIVTTADVEISFITACEMSLKLNNIQSNFSTIHTYGEPLEPIEDTSFFKLLQDNNLRFSMIGGVVEMICPSKDEDPRALNFKRGILSMIQNTVPKFDLFHTQVEKDVVGECEMNYAPKIDFGLSTFIIKTRNIPTCKQRSHIASSIHSVPYVFPEESYNLPVINTESFCEQEIRKRIIVSSKCEEKHKVVPLSSEKGEIATTITQNLVFVETNMNMESIGPIYGRTDIMYDFNDRISVEKKTGLDDRMQASKVLVNELLDVISSTSNKDDYSPAQSFGHLVAAMKTLKFEQLEQIMNYRRWNLVDKKAYVNALPIVGTASSVKFMLSGVLPITEELLKSLTYIQNPDIDILEFTNEMMDRETVPAESYLAVGTLVNNYCQHQPSCGSHMPVQNILNKITSNIPADCQATNLPDKVAIFLSLRGISNAGRGLNQEVFSLLHSCIANEKTNMEIRTTAIDAFRRVSCNESRSTFETVLRDSTEDAELRIQSYLGLMKCPNYQIIRLIEFVLDTEEVNQVGSFIWTHLLNIQESSSPSKIEIQSLISNRKFEDKYKSDFRKFSRNVEWSGFHSDVNVGAFVESNIIFSQKSYVPRVTSFNFTADLFGRSFNFFEVQSRFEGFEQEIAKFLGDHSASNNDLSLKVNNKLIKEKIAKSSRAEEYLGTAAEMSFDLKLFGEDVAYHHITGMNKIMNSFNKVHPRRILENIKNGQEFELEKAIMPLDSSYQVATAAGLPLTLALVGSANVDIAARVKGDISQLWMRNKGTFEGYIKPKISIDLKASMTVDSYSSMSGIELESLFMSSTVVDYTLDMDGTTAISFDINLPDDQMELFKASSQLILIHHSNQGDSLEDAAAARELVKSDSIATIKSEGCSPDLLLLKSKVCRDLQHPDNPMNEPSLRMLAYGPLKYRWSHQKTDKNMQGYKFRYHWGIKDNKSLVMTLLFSTPGATLTTAELGVNFTINFETKAVSLDVNLPRTYFKFEGQYTMEDDEIGLDASINWNGDDTTTLAVSFKIYEKSGKRALITKFLIINQGKTILNIHGEMEEIEKSDVFYYSVDLLLEANLVASVGEMNGTITGNIIQKTHGWDLDLNFIYSGKYLKNEERSHFTYNSIEKPTTVDGTYKSQRTWRYSSTEFPYVNNKGSISSKRFHGSIENVIKASLGTDFDNPEHEVVIYQKFGIYGGATHTFNSTIAFKYPKSNLDVILMVDFYDGYNELDTGFLFQYATGQAIQTRYHEVRRKNLDSESTTSWFLIVPGWIDAAANLTVKYVGPQKYDFELAMSWNPKSVVKFVGRYEDKSTRLKILHKLELNIRLPSGTVAYTVSSFLYDNTQISIEFQVKKDDGAKYKIHLAYINQLDDLKARERKIEINFYLPKRTFYWHSEITIGNYITISNDIHLDTYRDLRFMIQIQRTYNGNRRVHLEFLWDVNRDPQKKARMEFFSTPTSFDFNFSITFFGNEYRAIWKSVKKYEYDPLEGKSHWHHDHQWAITWKDHFRKLYRVDSGISFVLERGDGAEFVARWFLTTPFENWSNNFVNITYERNSDRVESTLNAEWHKDEFINMKYHLSKQFDGANLKAATKLEVLSSLKENMISMSTGAVIEKSPGNLDANAYFQWDEERIEVNLEAKDNSGAGELNLMAEAKILTTFQDYNKIAIMGDITASVGTISILGSVTWKELLYQLECKGEIDSPSDYLKGEFILKTPTMDSNDIIARIRIFNDYESRDENIEIFGRWRDKEIKLNGKVALKLDDFKAQLDIETPFLRFSQASILLAHSLKDHYKTEALVKWNKTMIAGLQLETKLKSLTNFLLSARLRTPHYKYKDIRAEIENHFSLSPEVRVHSKIYGQYNDLKYGIGAKYEQGEKNPRLSVGLELYTPIQYLEELSFDITDATEYPLMKYELNAKYGNSRALSVATQFVKTENSLQMEMNSKVNLVSIFGKDMENLRIEWGVDLNWETYTDFTIQMSAMTNTFTYKIFVTGNLDSEDKFNIDAIVALPFAYLDNIQLKIDYGKITNWEKGYLEAVVKFGRKTIFNANIRGTFRDLSIEFNQSLLKRSYERVTLTYKMIHLDIVKSKFEASGTLGNDVSFKMNGLVSINSDNYITSMDLVLASDDAQRLNEARIIVHGRRTYEGFVNKITIKPNDQTVYDVTINWEQEDNVLKIEAESTMTNGNLKEEYKAIFGYVNVARKPFLFRFSITGPNDVEFIDIDLEVQKKKWPYKAILSWHMYRVSSGSIEMLIKQFNNERVATTIKVFLKNPRDESKNYELITDFDNKSTKDTVNLKLSVDFTYKDGAEPDSKRVVVNGLLRQITADNDGVLDIKLEWPDLSPINFHAEATYVQSPSVDIRAFVTLNLGIVKYGIVGQVITTGINTSLNAYVWWEYKDDLNQYKIQFTTEFAFAKDGSVLGKCVARLPMIKGLEVSQIDFFFAQNVLNEFSVNATIANITASLNGLYSSKDFPATDGKITLSINSLWEGTPIKIGFNQSLTEAGFYGKYQLEYPSWDPTSRTYLYESVNASLHHDQLADGQKGVFSFLSKLTGDIPVSISYSFRFSHVRQFAQVKLGFAYKISFEFTGEHSTTIIDNTKTRKTLVSLDNIVWPVGFVYTVTEKILGPQNVQVTDSIELFDLEDVTRKTSINVVRTKTEEGGRFDIIAKYYTREALLSTGYINGPTHKAVDLIASLTPGKKVTVLFDWQERSKNPYVKDQKFIARVDHPLRTVLLDILMNEQVDTKMLESNKITSIDLNFNTDQLNLQSIPYKANIDIVRTDSTTKGRNYNTKVKISHHTLPTDIDFDMNLGTDYSHSLLFDLLLKYSKEEARHLSMNAMIQRQTKAKMIKNHFELKHKSTNLFAEAKGYLSYGHQIWSLVQDFVYFDENGSIMKSKINGGFNIKDKTLHAKVEAKDVVIDINMKIQEKEPGHWELTTTSLGRGGVPFLSTLRLHPSQPIFILTINNIRTNSSTSFAPPNPDYLRYNPETIVLEGGYEDKRYIHFSVKHLDPIISEDYEANVTLPMVSDADFSLKLNHSKLLSSHFYWRTNVKQEIQNEIAELIGYSSEIRYNVKEYLKDSLKLLAKEVKKRAQPIVMDIVYVTILHPLKFYGQEAILLKQYLSTASSLIQLSKQERRDYASLKYSVVHLILGVQKLSFVQDLQKKLAGGTIRTSTLRVLTRIKQIYISITQGGSSGLLLKKIKSLLSSLASAYDQAVKNWYLLFRNALDDLKMRIQEWLREKWYSLYDNYKDHIITTLHTLESKSYDIVMRLKKYMNKLGADIKSSSFITIVQKIYSKLKKSIDEVLRKNWKETMEMVYNYVVDSLQSCAAMFIKGVLPFTKDWKSELDKAWTKLYSYERAKVLIDFSARVLARIHWVIKSLDLSDVIINVAAFTIEHGYTIVSETAIQSQMRHITPKTDLIWSPEIGVVVLTQKLPFNWINLNEPPKWREMVEIPVISPVKRWLFPSTKFSFLDTWYRFFNLNFSPSTWIPPFEATAYIIGEDHLMTYDGKLINFKGSCEHILAMDVIQGTWAVTVRYSQYAPKTINVFIGPDRIEISKNFKVKINGKLIVLPHSIGSNKIWRTAGSINLKMRSGLKVSWNSVHDVVALKIPSTAFLNTAGLLGTNNNEPSDDMLTPEGKYPEDVRDLFESWKISKSTCYTKSPTAVKLYPNSDICDELFLSLSSPFKYCFHQVDPRDYYEICKQDYHGVTMDTSAVALAYRDRCTEYAVPVKLPIQYVQCEYINATSNKPTFMEEGQAVTLTKDQIYNAVDIVVLIEMNSCNRKRLQSKQFPRFIAEFNEGLEKEGVNSARYSVVAYGGEEPYSKPSLVSIDTEIFITSKNVGKYVGNLDYPSEFVVTADRTFEAITFASNLGFRSPSNVVFLLFPCKPCQETSRLHYSTMFHILRDNSATLHVFKQGYFDIPKSSIQKNIFGYDANTVFTSKDYKKVTLGDVSLKKQVVAPKNELNWCLPLAIETGGAVYTSEALMGGRKKRVQRLGRVVGRRVGVTARQDYDQLCLCLSTQEVTPILRCDALRLHDDYDSWDGMGDEEIDYDYDADVKPNEDKETK